MTLRNKILEKEDGILFYGLTPPKVGNSEERLREIADTQLERIQGLPLDGIVLYDIHDEADRNSQDRPFPFIETVDPVVYANDYLSASKLPKITYRCVGKYSPANFVKWLSAGDKNTYGVFVGAASQEQKISLSLADAYRLRNEVNPEVLLGGVAIPERHQKYHNEHLRVFDKVEQGCEYFVTQAVYNVEASKNFISEYYYHAQRHHLDIKPLIFTITPCGSPKTLEFMKWLGISIPKWLENDLLQSQDILEKSVVECLKIFAELKDFCNEKQIPVGCNIESVAIRKAEIEASIELVNQVANMFKTP